MDPAILDELRERQTSHLPADRVEAADEHRLGGVVDDEIDASGLLQGADVAALAADDAALHLVRGDGHHGHGHLGGVVDHDALDGGDHDVASTFLGRLTSGALDGPGQAHGIVLGLIADLLQERGLGLLRGHLAHPLECDDLLLAGPTQLLALGLQLLLLDQQLPVALLEHVRALVELLVALEQSVLEVAQIGALGATLVLQLPLHPDLFLLGLEDEILLLGTCLRDDATGLVLGGLDGLVRDHAPGEESHSDTADDRHEDDHDGDDIVQRSLPSGPGIRRYVSKVGMTT